MKIEEIETVDSDFKPFTFNLTVNSFDELAWLVARLNVNEATIRDTCYDQDNYVELLDEEEPTSITDLWEYLDDKLKDYLYDDICNECKAEQGCCND